MSDTEVHAQLTEAGCLTVCCCEACTPCYCKMPECLGIEGRQNCLCCASKWKCTHFFCGFQSCEQRLCVNEDEVCCGPGFFTLCKCASRSCCYIHACALPCDDDVPFGLALLGIFCINGDKYASKDVDGSNCENCECNCCDGAGELF